MVGRRANFFNLGGDSLAVFRAINRIQNEFGVSLSVGQFLTCPVLADMAQMVAGWVEI